MPRDPPVMRTVFPSTLKRFFMWACFLCLMSCGEKLSDAAAAGKRFNKKGAPRGAPFVLSGEAASERRFIKFHIAVCTMLQALEPAGGQRDFAFHPVAGERELALVEGGIAFASGELLKRKLRHAAPHPANRNRAENIQHVIGGSTRVV